MKLIYKKQTHTNPRIGQIISLCDMEDGDVAKTSRPVGYRKPDVWMRQGNRLFIAKNGNFEEHALDQPFFPKLDKSGYILVEIIG